MPTHDIVHRIVAAFQARREDLLRQALAKAGGHDAVKVHFEAEGYWITAHYYRHAGDWTTLEADPMDPVEGEPVVSYKISPPTGQSWR